MSKPDLGRIIAQTMAKPAENRTIEAITGEILDAKRAGGEAILTIGRCLIEAKEMLPHGEWKDWLADRVEFSERAAQRFMRLAREWSNPTALSDLGATKALTLLALPAEERERFMEDNNVIDMTTRQLEQAIKERDEARKAAEAAKAEASTAEQARVKMAEDMTLLNARLAGAREDRERALQDAAKLEEELAELKTRPVDVAVETVADPEALEKARAEAIAEMQAKLDKAKERQKKAEAQAKEAQVDLAQVKTQLQESERARKNAVLASDEDMATFQVLFQQAQDQANKMRGILLKLRGRTDPTAAQGVEKALRALSEVIGRCAE
jgi:DNA repair exonuclease SbcCD ATPase subunit